MKNKFLQLQKLVGNTPLIKIIVNYQGKQINVYAKAEWFNLSGSIKDRASLLMLKTAYEKGDLTKSHTVVEVTSGNMGVSLSNMCAYLGVNVIILMPKHVSAERKKIIKMLGAYVSEEKSFDHCFEKTKKDYLDKTKYYHTLQFDNQLNIKANIKTGKEILKKLPSVEMFVSGVGTGGTLMGVASALKKHSKTTSKIIALDPEASSLLTLGRSKGKHSIQGLSDDRIPSLYNESTVDEVVKVSDEDAISTARLLNKFGLPVGISGGANFYASVISAVNHNIENVVTIFPDDNKKYVSTKLASKKYKDTKFVNEINLINWEVI